MIIPYFDKGLQQFKNHKRKPKVLILVHIVVENQTSFNNEISLNRHVMKVTILRIQQKNW